jgi:hypothetical protein
MAATTQLEADLAAAKEKVTTRSKYDEVIEKQLVKSAGVFVSAELTGTGASQNVAHDLGVVPSKVFVAPTDLTPATVGSYSVVEGAHTNANIVLTVTSGKKFKVLAFA